MNRKLMSLAVAASAVIGCAGLSAHAADGRKLASEAKLSMAEARAIALRTYPGKIMKEELERERGGSGLRYSFDIRQGKSWREVGVDAKTGKILEDSAEPANPKD